MSSDRTATKLIANNRRARHDYTIVDTIECGIDKLGEIKIKIV